MGQPRVYIGLLVTLLAAALPEFVGGTILHMLVLTYVITVAALAWNVIGGFGGQISLGNSVFFGVTGYAMGILMVNYGLGYVPAFLIGIGLTLAVAIVVGYPTFNLTGHYFALATITVVEGMRFLARHFRDFTGGERGFSLVPATVTGEPLLNLTRVQYYHLALLLLVVSVGVTAWVRYTKLGHYLMAIRDDQVAASSLGIDVPRYKMYGWLTTATLTGVAGAVYTSYIQYLDPNYMFSVTQSVLYAITPVIGGAGTILGPVVGTLVVYPLQHIAITEFGGAYGAVTYMVYGALLIVLIVYAPEGLLPKVAFVGRWVEERAPAFTLGEEDDEAEYLPWRS